MMSFLSGMFRLPMNAMATGMDMFTQAARGMGRLAGEGLNLVGSSAEARPRESTTKRSRSNLDEGGVKLVEYVLVDLDHGREEIVDRGYRVLRDATNEKRFASDLIDAFAESPAGAGRRSANLEAYVEILEHWER